MYKYVIAETIQFKKVQDAYIFQKKNIKNENNPHTIYRLK